MTDGHDSDYISDTHLYFIWTAGIYLNGPLRMVAVGTLLFTIAVTLVPTGDSRSEKKTAINLQLNYFSSLQLRGPRTDSNLNN